jgi:hypothetical protein
MGEIKAIETVYKGYRFRSRLEARWAVFFDALAVPYEYESEGFDLGRDWYLPDFWLPTWDTWVEIKPQDAGIKRPADLLRRLGEATGKVGTLLCGPLWPRETIIMRIFDADYPDELRDLYGVVTKHRFFAGCRKCDGYCLVVDDEEIGLYGWGDVGPHTCRDHDSWPVLSETASDRVYAAYLAARQARFEHDETPGGQRDG